MATQTLFGGQTPANPVTTDDVAVNLGVRVRFDVAGAITASRFWRPAGDDQTSKTVSLWTAGDRSLYGPRPAHDQHHLDRHRRSGMTSFSMFAGDDVDLVVAVAGEGVDLEAAQAIRFQAAKRPAGAPVVSKAVGAGITAVSASQFKVSLGSADTEALSGTYYFEAEVIDAAGKVSTVLAGSMSVKPTLIKPGA
jgi:hypothetical protein